MDIPPTPRARFIPILLAAGMLLYLCPAGADMLAVSAGGGNLTTHQSSAIFFSYQKDAPNLFKLESLYELTFGYWSGPTANSVLYLSRIVRWYPTPPSYYISGMLGIGLIHHSTDHLGTTGQFAIRLAFGRKFGKYDLSIGETHFSNGKYALNLPWDGDNKGENFLTVMLAREF